MEGKIIQMIEQEKLDKAVAMMKKLFESSKNNAGANMDVGSVLAAMKLLVQRMCAEGQITACKDLVDEFFEVFSVAPPMKPRYFQQLGVEQAFFRLMNTRGFTRASQLLDVFDLKENRRILDTFFQTIVKQAEFSMAFDWIEKVNDPAFFTKEKLVQYMIRNGKIELALNAIKDRNLYDKDAEHNEFDVLSLISLLIRNGGIKEAIPFAKAFGFKDEEDFENQKCPQLRDVNIVKLLFHHRHWQFGFAYIQSSPFKKKLEEVFDTKILILLMIRRKDWTALSKFLKQKQVLEELEQPHEAADGEESNLKTDLVKTLVEDQEYVKATKYAIKFKLLDKFPLSFLLDKLIRRLEFGELNHIIKKLKLTDELAPFIETYTVNKILALKHFRRRFGATPGPKLFSPSAKVVEEVVIQAIETEIAADEEPPDDDELLVNADVQFMNFFQESNLSIKEGTPEVSMKLKQYVAKKMETLRTNPRVQQQQSTFKINPKAAEWSPDMQMNQMANKLRGMNMNANPMRQNAERMMAHEAQRSPVQQQERYYDRLKNIIGGNQSPVNGFQRTESSSPPLPFGMGDEFTGQRPRFLDSTGITSTLKPDAPTYFNRSDNYSPSRGMDMSATLSRQGSSSSMYNPEDQRKMQILKMQMERQRQQQQQQRMMQQSQMNSMRGNLEELDRRERIEKLISGLLTLNREAQVVRRSLAMISQKYQRAIDENDFNAKAQLEDEYKNLRSIKEQHRMKEKRVLLSARNDPDVAEAVAEFQRRRRALSANPGQMPSVNQMNEHQARQLHRLRQHEAEKQRQIMLRRQQMQQQQQQQNMSLQQLYQKQQQRQMGRFSPEVGNNAHLGGNNANNRSSQFLSSSFEDDMSLQQDSNPMLRQNSVTSTFSKSRSPTDFDYFGNFDEPVSSSFNFEKQDEEDESEVNFQFSGDAADFTLSSFGEDDKN